MTTKFQENEVVWVQPTIMDHVPTKAYMATIIRVIDGGNLERSEQMYDVYGHGLPSHERQLVGESRISATGWERVLVEDELGTLHVWRELPEK